MCIFLASFLAQALPDAEEWLRNNIIVAVGSMLINAPGKVLKGTVNTAHSIATKSIRGVGGLVNTTGVSGPGGFIYDVAVGFARHVKRLPTSNRSSPIPT